MKEGLHAEKDKVSLAGIIVNNTVRLNQSNTKYAITTLEDMWGTLEFPVFASVYEEAGELLERDEPLLITGRVNYRGEEVGLFVDKVHQLSRIRETEAKSMTFNIGSEPLNQDSISLLRNTLQKYSGDKTFTITILL